MPPALEILALDTATPQIRAPGSGDTYAAPRALAVTANPANTSLIAGSGYSLTGSDSTPMLDFSGDWATTGTPTALRLNIATDTGPSNAASNLLDLQVGGSSRFRVTKAGVLITSALRIPNPNGNSVTITYDNNFRWDFGSIVAINAGSGEVVARSLGLTSFGFVADLTLARDAANTLAQRRDTNAQTFRIYNTFTAADNFQRLAVTSATATLTAMSGASVTATALIPDGAVVVGVTARVTTAITGATGFEIGTAGDPDRWGDITGTAVGTTSDNRDWTAGTIECFTAATDVVITAKTSDFTAGAMRVVVHYLAGQAD
jgi:hypothetical protein